MCGQTLGRQLKIIAGPAPQEAAVAKQIMRLKCAPGIQAERGKIEVYPAGVFVKRVQIAKDDYDVGKVAGGLAIADHRGIIGVMKKQIGVALQGWILAANPVDAGDEILQAPRALTIPML